LYSSLFIAMLAQDTSVFFKITVHRRDGPKKNRRSSGLMQDEKFTKPTKSNSTQQNPKHQHT